LTDFTGFPRQTLTFLGALRRTNTKAWFDEHRADYLRYWLDPARAFVVAAGEALQDLAPVVADPRVNGSIFRINRDTRFSNGVPPYRDYVDFWFWEGGSRRTAPSGFYFRLSPDGIGLGAGIHGFDRDRLSAYRAAVVDPKAGPALSRAVTRLRRAGFEVQGEHYRRTPRGFEATNERRAQMLRHRALWIGNEHPPAAIVHSPELIARAFGEWKRMAPLHRWLVDHVG
jgi:uncharacterized protein (TIGR02453 family)